MKGVIRGILNGVRSDLECGDHSRCRTAGRSLCSRSGGVRGWRAVADLVRAQAVFAALIAGLAVAPSGAIAAPPNAIYLDHPDNPQRKPWNSVEALIDRNKFASTLIPYAYLDPDNAWVVGMAQDRAFTLKQYAWNHPEYPLDLPESWNHSALSFADGSILPTDAPTGAIVATRLRYIARGWTDAAPYFPSSASTPDYGWRLPGSETSARMGTTTPDPTIKMKGQTLAAIQADPNAPPTVTAGTDCGAVEGRPGGVMDYTEYAIIAVPDMSGGWDTVELLGLAGGGTRGGGASTATRRVRAGLSWAQVRGLTHDYNLAASVSIKSDGVTGWQDWEAIYFSMGWGASTVLPVDVGMAVAADMETRSLDVGGSPNDYYDSVINGDTPASVIPSGSIDTSFSPGGSAGDLIDRARGWIDGVSAAMDENLVGWFFWLEWFE